MSYDITKCLGEAGSLYNYLRCERESIKEEGSIIWNEKKIFEEFPYNRKDIEGNNLSTTMNLFAASLGDVRAELNEYGFYTSSGKNVGQSFT